MSIFRKSDLLYFILFFNIASTLFYDWVGNAFHPNILFVTSISIILLIMLDNIKLNIRLIITIIISIIAHLYILSWYLPIDDNVIVL